MTNLPAPEYITSVTEVTWGIVLVAATLVVHGFGMILTIDTSRTLEQRANGSHSFLWGLGNIILASWLIMLVHLLEIAVWAAFFVITGSIPKFGTSFYFALLEYTTLGSSINLSDDWNLLEGMIAIAGLMTFAWSTGVLFTIVQGFQNRQLELIEARRERRQDILASSAHSRSGETGWQNTPGFDRLPSAIQRLRQADLVGVRFASHIFIASGTLWLLLQMGIGTNPIWAISAMIAVSDPNMHEAMATFRGRIFNTLLGCTVGLLFLVIGSSSQWKLPLAMAVTVLLSTYVVRVPAMWRQAPITAALVIASGLMHHSKEVGIEDGLMRVIEVLLGCIVGLFFTWLMSRIWPVRVAGKASGASAP